MVLFAAEIPFHGMDPVLLDLPGPFDIRWYGLMYVVAFIAGGWILDRLARSGFLPLAREGAQDLVLWMVFGVLLGGRLGYVLFYKREILARPFEILAFWEGGMSFHGGLLGVVIACVLFCRRRKVKPGRVADSLALAVPPGILAVRLSNFINGELFGRVASESVPWAMRFPSDPVAMKLLGTEGLGMRARELKILAAIESGRWREIAAQVPLRHPSQVYEGLGEGLLLGLVLLFVYRSTRERPLAPWRYGGIFLLGYGLVRFGVEWFRQPDAHLGTVLGPFSMGQVLCSIMVLGGVLLIVWPRHGQGEPSPAPAEDRGSSR